MQGTISFQGDNRKKIPGFQSTGIWPFNRTAILTSKFAPSIVTDRLGTFYLHLFLYSSFKCFITLYNVKIPTSIEY
jgi:hypothetical protein